MSELGTKRPALSPLKAAVQVLAIAGVIMALVVSAAWAHCGSWRLVSGYLRGERFFAPDRLIELGEQAVGTQLDRTVRLVNLSSQDVRLLGAYRTCSCATLDEFPLTIAAGAEHELRVRVVVAGKTGPFVNEIKFFTDCAALPRFVVTVKGSVSGDDRAPLKPIPEDSTAFDG